MGAARANFPDAVIRFVPATKDDSSEAAEEPVVVAVELAAKEAIASEGINYFAIDIELELPGRSVPSTDGTTAAIAVEVNKVVFRDVRIAVEGIDDAELWLRETRGVEDPVEKRVGFLVVAQAE